jgi:hypothetical protein
MYACICSTELVPRPQRVQEALFDWLEDQWRLWHVRAVIVAVTFEALAEPVHLLLIHGTHFDSLMLGRGL